MINRRKAMIGTLLVGLVGAVGYYTCQTLFGRIHSHLDFSAGVWWMLLVVYALVMSVWAEKSILEGVYPLILPVIALFMGGSWLVFLGLLTGVLSWLRSGLYFRQGFRGLWLEALLSGGGMILVLGLIPTNHYFGAATRGSPVHNALGLWLFFLIQSVYFLLINTGQDVPDEARPRDRFEDARRRAEDILSG